VFAFTSAAWLHLERGEGRVIQERTDTVAVLSSEHGFPYYVAWGTVLRGEALIMQAQWDEGVTQVRQGWETQEGELRRTYNLAWLARGYGGAGQVDDGLAVVAEALRLVDKNDERFYEAELYRIKGELTLAQSSVQRLESSVTDPRPLTPDPQGEAEECFRRAIEIAQRQQAKSLELRAMMSLARLWQQQGKQAEARQRLAEIYRWFTEGFDTKDLQEAQALLEALA
jgi:ATP/maltotriose-dependent transcriptional regulator MalT